MATLFALGSFPMAIIGGINWYPLWWVFEPGWAIYRILSRISNGTWELKGEDLWMLGPPVAIACLIVSAGIWAAIGYHVGKYLGKKN